MAGGPAPAGQAAPPGEAAAVSWELAERVAVAVSRREPLAGSYLYSSLAADFEELTAEAEALVEAETGLRSLAGPARARVTDRAGWVRANVASFRRLLQPLADKVGPRLAAGPLSSLSRAATGVQVGTVLGWMSTRVLGQYDLLLIEDERPEDQDIVYYVGPNIVALERKYAFAPREFRLWIALHEVTHRAQFTGIEWMREHFLSLVHQSVEAMDPDPARFLEGLKRAADEVRAGRNPLAEAGLLGLVAPPEQLGVIRRVQALMSLLEGHGDVTMSRAGAGEVPDAGRFARVLQERRSRAGFPARLLQQLLGIEAKLKQYAMGERFIGEVEASAGPELLRRVWEGPDMLPTLEEIRDPKLWGARVGPAQLATG
ncbi:MAG TPA: zinc-dependent metalloprotease [Acidimicrobiales bacterium]|nr:zinc-dependent metalloprotease [Acidimicrobiales bacterium]